MESEVRNAESGENDALRSKRKRLLISVIRLAVLILLGIVAIRFAVGLTAFMHWMLNENR